jgi:2C-methyl-D-erythritol 2,4-cyclodiphosphate synthase
MWKPNEEGYLELLKLLQESSSHNNKTQFNIFNVSVYIILETQRLQFR